MVQIATGILQKFPREGNNSLGLNPTPSDRQSKILTFRLQRFIIRLLYFKHFDF